MNVLAPVRRDRVIADLPAVRGGPASPGLSPPSPALTPLSLFVPSQCFRKEAALHSRPAFHPTVAGACQEQRTGTVGSVPRGLGSPLPG